ncbi:MAG: tRNA (uridine(34)/cytosine(34)/5-carboxymethylaminomethyluridine(34)-2'-O)-methyltransferase TrmL [Culicoidibacterales bacterium]
MIHIILYQPEIPQNTGNIMRTCVATGAMLHLIEPLGFSLEEKQLRRAAVDYYEQIKYKTYPNYEAFIAQNKPSKIYFFTRHGKKNHTEMDYTVTADVYFMFGQESSGIPKQILRDNLEDCLRLPMNDLVRSLNLSNCAAILIYEALRQRGFEGLFQEEPDTLKGSHWLEQ